ncbi:hypothetical protein M514_02454 [Trichuris suis]|uniref:Uncharacterized protein n=1 Tax=Trichuris suis TaxID=68888 RepID=A0A085MHT1_9BILA|nr:hypothetical protein M513_02454 [Trichuris suis]KFD68118.1 hypothetical protein M514_02454 [Trichuris suis]
MVERRRVTDTSRWNFGGVSGRAASFAVRFSHTAKGALPSTALLRITELNLFVDQYQIRHYRAEKLRSGLYNVAQVQTPNAQGGTVKLPQLSPAKEQPFGWLHEVHYRKWNEEKYKSPLLKMERFITGPSFCKKKRLLFPSNDEIDEEPPKQTVVREVNSEKLVHYNISRQDCGDWTNNTETFLPLQIVIVLLQLGLLFVG